MEATNTNMAMLHRAVSTELGSAESVSTEPAVPQPASALPEVAPEFEDAPRTPPHMSCSERFDTPSKGSRISMQSDEADAFCAPDRGCTWVEKRAAWVLRYKDKDGVKRQKKFKADDGSSDSSKAEARASAMYWLAEFKEALRV